MRITRPSFVLTDAEVGLPERSAADVERQLRRLPVPATVYTLAKLAQWRAAMPTRPLDEELGTLSHFLAPVTQDRANVVLRRGRHQAIFRYAAIVAAARVLIARGTPSAASDPDAEEAAKLGELLLAINRLLGDGAERTVRLPPDAARRRWLGEQVVMARELPGVPVLGWVVGASVFRRVADGADSGVVDVVLRRARRPTLAAQFSGLALWLGHVAAGQLGPNIYSLGDLTGENRAAAWLARRLGCRRKDGPDLLRGWCSSPAATGLRDTPFFVYRGTAACVDPHALGLSASFRFGALVQKGVAGLPCSPAERRAVERWTANWPDELEAFVRDELGAVAGASERPAVRTGQRCDLVARFGAAVAFVEVKLTYPSPATLRLRDRERVHGDLLERFAAPGRDGLAQVMATMKAAAAHPSLFPRVAPTAADRWWPIVVAAEPIPNSQEWREEWQRAAEHLPGPRVQRVEQPLFFSMVDLCWFIDTVRTGVEVHTLLARFARSEEISFSNFASAALRRSSPSWLDARFSDHHSWLERQTR